MDQSSGVWEASSPGGILEGVGSSPQEVQVHGSGRRARRRSVRDERGQALVEFVLILPIFLVITFGVIEFGKAFNYWIDSTHLANEAVRYAAVNRWPTCPSNDSGNCTQQLREYIRLRANTGEFGGGGTPNVPGKGLGPFLTAPPYDGDTPDRRDGVVICFPAGTSGVGDPVRAIVQTKYTLAVVDGLLGAIGLGGVGELDLHATATQRIERTPTANRVLAEDVSTCPA